MLKEVCEEFKTIGIKKDVNPRTLKESFAISKQANGQWFKSTKLELHAALTKDYLDLSAMTALKKLTDLLDERDSEFKKLGGRIFITESVVYQIKKGTEYPMIIEQSAVETNGKYKKIIEELLKAQHERDRFRIEETYLLTKSPKGEWSASTNHINFSGKKIIFDLNKMPNLKLLAQKINKNDPSFEANGGRVFITPTRIYRIKNQVETDFKF